MYNNTFVGPANQFVVVLNGTDDGLTLNDYSGFEFKNSIVLRVADHSSWGLISNEIGIGGIDTNVFWDNSSGEDGSDVDGEVGVNEIIEDPDFVSESLTIANQSYSCGHSINGSYPYSPAFEAGLDLSNSGVVDDIRGADRPDGTSHDIDAFEVPH